MPFIVTELGADTDPFMLHFYAPLAEKEGGAYPLRRAFRPFGDAFRQAQTAHARFSGIPIRGQWVISNELTMFAIRSAINLLPLGDIWQQSI